MRRSLSTAVALTALLALPARAASQSNVAQLAEMLSSARSANASDEETARKVAEIDLTERLSGDACRP
jgi:hypothetical protein